MENVVYNVAFTWFEWCGIGIIGAGAIYCFIMELRRRMRSFVLGFMSIAIGIALGLSIYMPMKNKFDVIRAFQTGTTIIDRQTGAAVDDVEYQRLYYKYFDELHKDDFEPAF
jgi:hypothetical protein